MFGMRHHGSDHDGHWAVGRGGRGRHGFGFGGRHGFGGGDMVRAGRMLATGDLRLIALALIAAQPRHGYEIIKVLEEKTAGWYSPSPGIVYPTLTYLEEAGYVTAQAEGTKKLYTVTDEGRAYLDQNRDFVDAVLERLTAIGSKISRMRRRFGRDDEDEHDDRRGHRLPPLVRAALENLRDVTRERFENDPDAEAKLVEILARAAQELKKA
jgi:DNA-binding PadR family transcriptional regulator